MAKSKTEDKGEKKTDGPVFHVFQGSQPKFTGSKGNCDAYAAKLIADALHQGIDLSSEEHCVSVKAVDDSVD